MYLTRAALCLKYLVSFIEITKRRMRHNHIPVLVRGAEKTRGKLTLSLGRRFKICILFPMMSTSAFRHPQSKRLPIDRTINSCSWSELVCAVGLCIPPSYSCKHTLVLDAFTAAQEAAKHKNANHVLYDY